MKIKPQCLNPNDKGGVRGIAYCSNGYLLPCCWLDSPFYYKELAALGLYDQELKLENNQKIEDIVNSKQWKNFIEIISTDSEKIPQKCLKQCGVKNGSP